MQYLIGCLTWLSTSTQPEISTITNILAKYLSKPTKAHINAVKYLKWTRLYSIGFKSTKDSNLKAFVKFPIPNNKITALTDANWGPQDQPKLKGTTPAPELELFTL